MSRLPFDFAGTQQADPFGLARGMLRGRQGFFDPTFGGMLPKQPSQTGANAQDYPPTEQEEHDLRSQGLLGATLGGLQAAGNVLDAPGSAVRGALWGLGTGDFSPVTEGFMDPSKRKYGSNFLDAIGWTAPETWGGSDLGETISNSAQKIAHGLVGFGVDVATDPLSLIGIGGKTAQGLAKVAEVGRTASEASAAARAGSMGETVAAEIAGKLAPGASTLGTIGKEISAGDRAAVNIHAPWWLPGVSKAPIVSIGAGNTIAGKAAAKMADAFAFNPAMRLARGLFSPAVGGAFSTEGQRLRDELFVTQKNMIGNAKEAAQIFRHAYRNGTDGLADQLESIAKHHGANGDPAFVDDVLRGIQTDDHLRNADAILDELNQRGNIPGIAFNPSETLDLRNRMIDYHTNLRKFEDHAKDEWNKLGGQIAELNDAHAAYAFRKSSIARNSMFEEGWNWRNKTGEFDANPEIGRNAATRDQPGSEPGINAKAMDAPLMRYVQKAPTDPAAARQFVEALALGNHTAADQIVQAAGDAVAPLELTARGLAAVGKAAKLDRRQLAALGEMASKHNATLGMGWNMTKAQVDAAELQDLLVRRSWENHDQPNIRRAFADQFDQSTGKMQQTLRDANGKIIKGPNGKYQDWVKFFKQGTPEEKPFDYFDEMSRFDPANPANPNQAIDEDHPIMTMLRFLSGFGPEKLDRGVYDQNIADDLFNYVGSLASRSATLRTAHNWLSREGIMAPASAGTIKNGVELPAAWDASGVDPRGMAALLETHPQFKPQLDAAVDQAAQDYLQRASSVNAQGQPWLNRTNANPMMSIDEAREAVRDKATRDFAATIQIHPAAVKGLKAFADLAEASNRTGKPGPIIKLLDRYNTVFKSLAYNIWPPGHLRHIIGRATNSIMDGRAGAYDVLHDTLDTYRYLSKLGKAGAEKEIDPFVLNALKEFDGAKIYRNFTVEDALRNPELLRGRKMQAGGLSQALSTKGSTWNPLAIPGMPGFGEEEVAAGKPLNYLVKAGNAVQGLGDYTGQAGHFIALRRQNFTVQQAAQIVRETHYLSELSPFEKAFLSRVIPFERFSTRNIPYQLAMLAQEPGGRTAQLVRGLTEGTAESQKGAYVPEWMRENTVYPWDKNEKGEQGYFSSTLAPQHELNDIVLGHGLLGDIARTGEKFAAKASPLALLPVERPWSEEGRQLFTGRKIADLEKPLQNLASEPLTFSADQPLETAGSLARAVPWAAGHIPGIDSILHYLPTSRVTAEGERLPGISRHGTLPQFLTNMLGLGKVSYYNDQKWKELDMRHALEEQAQAGGATPWTTFSLPQRTAAKMTPEQIAAVHALLRRREGLTRNLKEQAQQRQQAAPQAQPTL